MSHDRAVNLKVCVYIYINLCVCMYDVYTSRTRYTMYTSGIISLANGETHKPIGSNLTVLRTAFSRLLQIQVHCTLRAGAIYIYVYLCGCVCVLKEVLRIYVLILPLCGAGNKQPCATGN